MQEISIVSDTLRKDVELGFSAYPKYIPFKYFYDDKGSRIFQQIMRMPEYYLTHSEYEIFDQHKHNILKRIRQDGEMIELIELGAGDGLKTSLLIDHFIREGVTFSYTPVDISEEAIHQLVDKMKNAFPGIIISEQVGDYFEIMMNLETCKSCKKVALFLGSNIGNFSEKESIDFFRQLNAVLDRGDMVLTGFDLVKDPELIRKAYDDSNGYTRKFNLNLLSRLNRELGANFDLKKFMHCAVYDPQTKTAKSYLISSEKQKVFFAELDRSFQLDKWESIFTEMSRKFTPLDIQKLAGITGYHVIENFYDHKGYFLNSLWVKA